MRREYFPHLDWLKAVGMGLIVWGHVAAATTVAWTPPVYPKQLGVAFFVCAMGFSLRLEDRHRWRVVFNRYFDVFCVALLCALFVTVVGMIGWSDPVESNYLPLALGANVLMDAFPANPTTWYVGTYLHLLLLWAVMLRGLRRVSPGLLAGSLFVEVAFRATMIAHERVFVAYMVAPNWMTLLLLGIAFGDRIEAAVRHVHYAAAAALGVLALVWPLIMTRVTWDLTFPFMSPAGFDPVVAAIVTSVAISTVYLAYTSLAFLATQLLPASGVIRFLARNTVIVFIAHMPLYYALDPLLREYLPAYGPRVAVEFFLLFPLLAAASEWLRSTLQPLALREALTGWATRRWQNYGTA